jgi:hypothetical protein
MDPFGRQVRIGGAEVVVEDGLLSRGQQKPGATRPAQPPGTAVSSAQREPRADPKKVGIGVPIRSLLSSQRLLTSRAIYCPRGRPGGPAPGSRTRHPRPLVSVIESPGRLDQARHPPSSSATLRWRLVRPSLQTRTLGRAAIGPAHPSHTSDVTDLDQKVLQRAFLASRRPWPNSRARDAQHSSETGAR